MVYAKSPVFIAQNLLQESQKQEDSLIPMEQAARQKVAEMKATRDSEKNQSTALKAILQAKESNEIQGIYGRLGDLGAIDGMSSLCLCLSLSLSSDGTCLIPVQEASQRLVSMFAELSKVPHLCIIMSSQSHGH